LASPILVIENSYVRTSPWSVMRGRELSRIDAEGKFSLAIRVRDGGEEINANIRIVASGSDGRPAPRLRARRLP